MRRFAVVAAFFGVIAVATPARAKDTVAKCTEAAEAAQRKRASGQLRSAAQMTSVCIAPECPAVVRRHCAKWREDLVEITPSLVFQVVDAAGKDVTQGKIFVDDELASETLDGRAFTVDPGAHKVQWKNGDQHVEREIVVREGEHARNVVLNLPAPAMASPTAPVPPAAAAPTTTTTTASGRSPWPWIIGGVGLAAGLTGGVLWGVGASSHSDLESTCAKTSSCREADVSRAKTELVVGDVLVGVGIVAIATTVVWLIVRDTSSPTTSARR